MFSSLPSDPSLAPKHILQLSFFGIGVGHASACARHAIIVDACFRISCLRRCAVGGVTVDDLCAMVRARFRSMCLHNAKTRRFVEAESRWPHRVQRVGSDLTANGIGIKPTHEYIILYIYTNIHTYIHT